MMENTKLVLVILILMASCGTLRVASDTDLGDYLGGMLGGSGVTCMEKLLPCQPYLVPGPNPPPPDCCNPIRELLVNDTKCFCDTLNNPLVRGSLNVSIDDIMKLPHACNQTFDMAVCNSTTSGTNSSAPATTASLDSDSTPDNDSTPDTDNDSTPDNDKDSTPDSDSKASGANGKFISSSGREYMISLSFLVAFLLTVY